MPSSIKLRIFQALKQRLALLKSDSTVRVLELKNSLLHTEKVFPALHITPGDEQRIDEDNRGYTMSLEIRLKLMFGAPKEKFERAADLVSRIQACVEADLQITETGTREALADQLTYQGEYPVIDDETPMEGVLLIYVCQYRRLRADPTATY
jgi:hypothetical protein